MRSDPRAFFFERTNMMRTTVKFTAAGVVVIAAAVASAQSAPSAQSAMTEKIEKRVLTLAGAGTVAAAAEAEAHRLNTTGAIAVVDDGGSLLYLVRIDNTFPAGPAVA